MANRIHALSLAACAAALAGVAACSGAAGNGPADSGAPSTSGSSPSTEDDSPPSDDGGANASDASVADGSTSRDAGPGGEDAAQGDAAGPLDGSLVYPPYAGNGGTVADGVAQLNLYRAFLGLSAVTLDSASSIGCTDHIEYLVCAAAAKGEQGYLEHTETVTSCAVDGGEPAGTDSDLAWGQETTNGMVSENQSLGEAVDLWNNGLYHRNPLLDPGLTKVGAASSDGYNCLDYGAAGNTATVVVAAPVLFPPDGATDVPVSFGGNEEPCPTAANPLDFTTCGPGGFIVTANWYGWAGGQDAISAVASATLTDTEIGAVVPLFAYYADNVDAHNPAPGYIPNEIALVPQASLADSHTFLVNIEATVSGQPTTLSWSFTTGSRMAPSL